MGEGDLKMKPILWKINGLKCWYIWSFKHKDILEGNGCGPFLTKEGAWEAITQIERAAERSEK